jgi:Phytanoyl-CoA dioxygenase (PhyH)
MAATWSDLARQGYTIVPAFLTPSECSALTAEWRSSTAETPALRRRPSPRLAAESMSWLVPRVLELAATIGSDVCRRQDIVRSGQFYSTGRERGFLWHTDHDAYYITQDAASSLNFWIATLKSEPRRSGVCVAPLDRLRGAFPELAEWSEGRGAIEVRTDNAATRFEDLERLSTFVVDRPNALEEIAEAPHMVNGDLLVMRGDLFHRTQDRTTVRVSVSLRTASSGSVVSRTRLGTMGCSKFYTMATKRLTYAMRLACFEIAKSDTLTIGESEAIYARLARAVESHNRIHGGREPTGDEFRQIVWGQAASYGACADPEQSSRE